MKRKSPPASDRSSKKVKLATIPKKAGSGVKAAAPPTPTPTPSGGASSAGEDEVLPPLHQKTNEEELEECSQLLESIMSEEDSAPFLEPVDWEALGLPEYPQIIKEPMDCGTMKKKLEAGDYKTADDFASDMRLVWSNAKTFNEAGSQIYDMAHQKSRQFERRFEEIMLSRRTREKLASLDDPEELKEERVKLFTKMETLRTSPKVLAVVLEYLEKTVPACIVESKDRTNLNIDLRLVRDVNILTKAIALSTPKRVRRSVRRKR